MSLETNKFLQENCVNFRKGKKVKGTTSQGEEVYSCKNFSKHLFYEPTHKDCENCINWKTHIKEKEEYQKIQRNL